MRLRAALAQAWIQIDEVLMRRAAALALLVAAVQSSLQDEASSLQALLSAQERQRQAALAAKARPFSTEAITAWSAAERELASPLARMRSLLEQSAALQDNGPAAAARRQLDDMVIRLTYARQAFNDAADAYNAALDEFPTRLLRSVFRFGPTARL
jgi:LemA protein